MRKITSKFPGKKILLVEDYFINQEVTKDILEFMDCEVDIAETGKEALEKVQQTDYDLILLDLQIPEMDGYQVCQEIRKGEKKHALIIALTASALVGDKEKCLAAGMDDYLSKPIETDKLEDLLLKYFRDKTHV